MSGADIIAAIILLALVIAIGVYLFHWLYRRTSKGVSFVRTGLGGEKVVISGGAFILPIIHDITWVGMHTLCIEVKSYANKSLITKDRIRVELGVEFYVRVVPTEEAVSTAASALGSRTLEPDELREIIEGRFVDALGVVAAQMTLEEMQEERGLYTKRVKDIAEESVTGTGLGLETVSMISLNQADLKSFNPDNIFDAEGLTHLIEQTELRKRKRNEIERDTSILINQKNLETEQKQLEIDRDKEFYRISQHREIESQKAKEDTLLAKERSEQERAAEEARLADQEEVEKSRIKQQQAIEIERTLRDHKLTMEVEGRRKQRNEIEKTTEIEIQQMNLDAEVKTLNISKQQEFERLKQQQEISIFRAKQKTTISKEEAERESEAEQARLASHEAVKKVEQTTQNNIELSRIEKEEGVRLREIENQKLIELESLNREFAVLKQQLNTFDARKDAEVARARAEQANEAIATAREKEVANRRKTLALIKSEQEAESEALHIIRLAKAENEAAVERKAAAENDAASAKLKYEAEASGKAQLNEAENILSDASRESALRLQVAGNLDSIIREAVRPMENIDAIKIYEVNGIPGYNYGADGQGGSVLERDNGTSPVNDHGKGNSRGSLSDNIVSAALRYRAQAPFVDNLLGEIGMSSSEISRLGNVLGEYDADKKHKENDSKKK